MKNVLRLLFAFCAFAPSLVFAQGVPQQMNYQGVARDNAGNVLANQNVGIQLSVFSDSINGTLEYSETQTTTTNAFGLFNIHLGDGSVVSGSFSTIDWGNASHFLKVGMDPSGGTAYQNMGNSQLLSVPYALYAATSGTGGPTGPQGATGADGSNGIDGATGPTGPTGAFTSLEDADVDTKIQVEESADEDIIRFDMGGTEYFRMDSGRLEVLNTGLSVFIGEDAGANDDFSNNRSVFVGYNAGLSNTIGNVNTAIGGYALYSNTTGNNNIAIGYLSLYNNINGEYNTANGYAALSSNTEGDYNTANGSRALGSNTAGGNNTANGRDALYYNETGNNNTANGYSALHHNTTGNLNTANGKEALYGNTSGFKNVAIGYRALYSNSTGSYNTAIGNGADVVMGDFTNATAIGANALVEASNSLVLGSNANVGIGTSVPDYKLEVEGYTASSNQISIIPLWQAGSNYTMSNTSGADLSNCESGLIPTAYSPTGDVEVKLVVRITSTSAGTNNFQLRAHDGITEAYPIVSTDTWTFSSTQSGIVASSEWKDFAAGTNFQEMHLYGWLDAGTTNFNSVYLMVRPNR